MLSSRLEFSTKLAAGGWRAGREIISDDFAAENLEPNPLRLFFSLDPHLPRIEPSETRIRA